MAIFWAVAKITSPRKWIVPFADVHSRSFASVPRTATGVPSATCQREINAPGQGSYILPASDRSMTEDSVACDQHSCRASACTNIHQDVLHRKQWLRCTPAGEGSLTPFTLNPFASGKIKRSDFCEKACHAGIKSAPYTAYGFLRHSYGFLRHFYGFLRQRAACKKKEIL